MRVDSLPENSLNFRKFEKCRICSMLMSRTSVALILFLPQTSMLLQNAAKGWNSLGRWRLNLWAAELGIYYSNVYGKIIFAPLNILASVYIRNLASVYIYIFLRKISLMLTSSTK